MTTGDEALAALEDTEADVRRLAYELREARDEVQKIAWLLVGESVVTISRADMVRIPEHARVEWVDDIVAGGRKVRRVREGNA